MTYGKFVKNGTKLNMGKGMKMGMLASKKKGQSHKSSCKGKYKVHEENYND